MKQEANFKTYFEFYNFKHPHQSIGYKYSAIIYEENLQKSLVC
jgi:transposase InsO family protein